MMKYVLIFKYALKMGVYHSDDILRKTIEPLGWSNTK